MNTKGTKAKSPEIHDARRAIATADAGARSAQEAARSAKSALKEARKASKRADKVAKKARKQARRARKTLKTLLAREAKLKKRTASKNGSVVKKKAPPVAPTPVDATSAEILGEHR